MKFTLNSKGPTDLRLSIQPFTESPVDHDSLTDGTLTRICQMGGIPMVVEIQALDVDELEFLIHAIGSSPLPPQSAVKRFMRRKFSLNVDLPDFYRFVESIPQLAHIPLAQSGLRPILKDTLLEALCLAVADQQVNVTFAASLKRTLFRLYGESFTLNGTIHWLFPAAPKLAALPPEILFRHRFTRRKSEYIIGLARRFLAEPDWESIQGTDMEIVAKLCTIRGIGPWTAEYAAMIGLGLLDTLPATDVGLQRMTQKIYTLSHRPSAAVVRELAENWAPWRGLVTFYLWHQEDMLLRQRQQDSPEGATAGL